MSTGSLWRLMLAALLAAALAVASTRAVQAEDPRDQEVREIASALACQVCSGESVADSQSPLAQQMRGLIRKKLEQGESKEEILQYFVDRYGEGILLVSPGAGAYSYLWWLVALVLVWGMGAVAFTHYRRRVKPARDPSRASPTREAAEGLPAPDLPDIPEEDLARFEKQVEEALGHQSRGLPEGAERGRRREVGNADRTPPASRGPSGRKGAPPRK